MELDYFSDIRGNYGDIFGDPIYYSVILPLYLLWHVRYLPSGVISIVFNHRIRKVHLDFNLQENDNRIQPNDSILHALACKPFGYVIESHVLGEKNEGKPRIN